MKAQLIAGNVNSTITLFPSVNRDSDLDNGVITHEYGHGISIRLTGWCRQCRLFVQSRAGWERDGVITSASL